MSTFEETFKAALGWLAKQRDPNRDIVEVIEFSEDAHTLAGCPTCGSETSITVEVMYLQSDGSRRIAELEGSLSDLIPLIGGYPGWPS